MLDLAPYASVITALARFDSARRQQQQQLLAELITAISKGEAIGRERNRLGSAQLNIFRFFNPGETTHSRLLVYLLDPRAGHGQGTLFLV